MKTLPFHRGMDVPRTRPHRVPPAVWITALAIALAVTATVALRSLLHGAGGVSVDRTTIVTDVVQRGDLERSISVTGTLVPQEVRVVAAIQPGIIEDVLVKPGATVEDGTPIARTSNPDLDAAVITASAAVDAARAQVRSVQAQTHAAVLAQESSYSTAVAQSRVDRTNADSLRGLLKSGFVAAQTFQIAAIKATESSSQVTMARAQIGASAAEADANVAAAQAQLAQAVAQLGAKESELAALVIRSKTPGVVQSVAVDPGTRVDAGTEIARVADERDLKAVLEVPESLVGEVGLGMPARLDTGNAVLVGHVARIAPAAQNGSVAVDATFSQGLPAGVRPQQSVNGTIELERLRDVVSIARPAGASDDQAISLYRLEPGSQTARQVRVRLGRGSADRVEVISGLEPGDIVIVSDTSSYNGAPALVLH